MQRASPKRAAVAGNRVLQVTLPLASTAYLLWLGWRQWRAPVAKIEGGATQAAEPDLTAPQRVLRGFLTNVTNPKGIVFMAAVLPQFIQPTRPLWLQLLLSLIHI